MEFPLQARVPMLSLRRGCLSPALFACLAISPQAFAWQSAPADPQAPPPQGAPTAFPAIRVDALHFDIRPFDVPAALAVVRVAPSESGRPGVSITETLVGVPGILARDRQNFAQDVQMSIRGFGARATFGVRGIRLYVDGIPATMPDGQGQISHPSLDSADRIAVLRGPFSVLYGNAAGGVVQSWSAEGTPTPVTTLAVNAGSDGAVRYAMDTRGTTGRLDYNISGSDFRSDGYRRHSRVHRESGNARFGIDMGSAGKLVIVANHLDQPLAEDPLGLTRAQADAGPRQAPAVAIQYDTRKSIRQEQLGVIHELQLGGHDRLRVMAYQGRRNILQYQSIPVASQRNPLSSGGVVALDSRYDGIDARWTHSGDIAGRSYQFVLGFSADEQIQRRRGYENFIGSVLGVRGALRRDEDDDVGDTASYAQWHWRVADRWSLLLGVRHEAIRFHASDRYVAAANPDDSGRVEYTATTPVAGLEFRPRDNLRLYASFGKGFETPSFNELGYRSDGLPGLAWNLRPALSDNVELGMKWRGDSGLAIETAAFRSDTRDELAVATNENGRSTYRNVGATRRQGIELSVAGPVVHGWQVSSGFTLLQARFRTPFLACATTPCSSANTAITAGTRMPGVPERYASIRLQHGGESGWREGIDLGAVGSITVDDRASQRAGGYALVGIDTGYAFVFAGDRRLLVTARVDNLADRRYIGSVIVNDANGRYFEPGPGRSFMLGLRITL